MTPFSSPRRMIPAVFGAFGNLGVGFGKTKSCECCIGRRTQTESAVELRPSRVIEFAIGEQTCIGCYKRPRKYDAILPLRTGLPVKKKRARRSEPVIRIGIPIA